MLDRKLPKEDSQEELDNPDSLLHAPDCYRGLKQVFSKAQATSLPHHRQYDCNRFSFLKKGYAACLPACF